MGIFFTIMNCNTWGNLKFWVLTNRLRINNLQINWKMFADMTSFFQNKIHSISTEKKKRKYIKGGMYETKVTVPKIFGPTSFIFQISSKWIKTWNSYLNQSQLMFHTILPSKHFIFFRFSTDTSYFILKVASLSAKILQFYFQISWSQPLCHKIKLS